MGDHVEQVAAKDLPYGGNRCVAAPGTAFEDQAGGSDGHAERFGLDRARARRKDAVAR